MEERCERLPFFRTPQGRASARNVPKESGLQARVIFLDDTEHVFEVEPRILGCDFYNRVCGRLKLLEKEYFGLEFRHHIGGYVWVELLKPLAKQIKNTADVTFRFVVKFFPPDPGQLQKDLTRYLFALQIKQDLSNGSLTCNDNSAALLVSYLLQSELGDYDEDIDMQHLDSKKYVPNQDYLDKMIMRLHKRHRGRTPAESDALVLEVARKLDMYGIRLQAASDGEGMRINLAVTHMGVLVFQGNRKINTFSWAKIRKLSFKRKRFLIKLHEKIEPSGRDTVEFAMACRDVCKAFWKMCVEHHAFFRRSEEPKSRHRSLLHSKGSCFRYSGRTQKQLLDCVGRGEKTTLPFERKYCRSHYDTRQCSSSPDLLTDVSKQVYRQSQVFPDSTFTHVLKENTWSLAALGGKRSQSAVEVAIAMEMEPPRALALPSTFTQPRSSSLSGAEAGPGPTLPSWLDSSQLVLLYPRLGLEEHPSLCSAIATIPLSALPLSTQAYLTRTAAASPLGHAPCPAHRHAFLHHLARQSSPLLQQQGTGAMGGRFGPRTSRTSWEETGHFSDDSSYHAGLPKRSWGQSDAKQLRPSPANTAAEFRPLGHYPHLSRRRTPVRPSYLPLNSAPAPERPASLCVLGAGSSGEFSDSDTEGIYPHYYPPGAKTGHSLARMRVSSGSLQLDQVEEEDSAAGSPSSSSALRS
ncbi:hypothetical protein GJAV_G00125310 [Gymnothorax javanicus]|nr:hypothetical protein GJAV_G00125310 [Gymnothorax javanicus]